MSLSLKIWIAIALILFLAFISALYLYQNYQMLSPQAKAIDLERLTSAPSNKSLLSPSEEAQALKKLTAPVKK